MKITFICISLEPGRDGIGDYTRRLATEICSQNHEVSLVAIQDVFIEDIIYGDKSTNPFSLKTLRIPAHISKRDSLTIVSNWIETENPEWISLQFGPYGYHRYGLPYYLIGWIKKITKCRKLNIMFHETWLGKDEHSSFKGKLISFLQKKIISHLLNTLNPKLIHTHLPLHQRRIMNLGFRVNALPLFSNIPISILMDQSSRDFNKVRVGFFSQVGHSPLIINFLNALNNDLTMKGYLFEILIIGGKESENEKFIQNVLTSSKLHINVKTTGFLSEQEISVALKSCDLAISPIPRHALGKSSSVAAFLSHGIPIAAPVVNKNKNPLDIGFFSKNLRSSILLEPNLRKLDKLKSKTEKCIKEISIECITHTYLKDLAL